MNAFTENLLIGIPEQVANMQLPDPDLRDYYRDQEDRIFWLDGDVNETTLDVVKMIIRCNREDKGKPVDERKPIRLMIDSGGGDVQVMLAVIKAMNISKTPVWTINYCNAMSAAGNILAAGHKRYSMPGCVVMVHSGSCQYGGTMEQAESMKKYGDALVKKANDEFLSRTKIDAKKLKKKGASDWYLDENEALECGIIDKIINDFDEVF